MKRLNFYIIISLVSIAIAVIGIVNSTDGSVSFIWQRFDYFTDFYSSVFYSRKEELYTELGNIYPPLLMILLKYSAGLITFKAKIEELRSFSAPLSLGILIICFCSVAYTLLRCPYIYKASRMEFLTLTIQFFTLSFMTFALDRMNLIIFSFIILFPLILMVKEDSQKFKKKLRFILWSLTLIKQYFLIPALLIEILFAQLLKDSKRRMLFFSSIYILLNQIPFFFVYNGNVLDWLNNTFNHKAQIENHNSWHFALYYYSLSPQAVLDIYPFTNFQDFSTFKTQWHNLYQIAGKIISFILTIELIRRLIILISLYRSKSNFPLREKGNEFQISLNLSLFLIFLIPLMIMLLWIPSIGFYAGILLIIPICLGYLFGNKRNRLTIHFSLIGLSAIGASYPAFFSPSFAFCIMTWCFVFYSMNIVMHYINEHCLNRGQAQSNSIQLQSQDV